MRLLLALAAACALAAAPAAGPFKALDADLERAERAAARLKEVLSSATAAVRAPAAPRPVDRRSARLARADAVCRAAFTPAAVPAGDGGMRRPLSRYLACSAAAARSTAPCVASPSYGTLAWKDEENPAFNCVTAYHLVRFVQARLAGGDGASVCREANAALGAPDAAALCARAAAGDCGAYLDPTARWWPVDTLESCQRVFTAATGAPGACRGMGPEAYGYDCADVAALAAARAGGDCGGSALCRAAAGLPGACAPLLEALRDAYCRARVAEASKDVSDSFVPPPQGAPPRPADAAMAAVARERAAVDALLVAVGEALEAFEPKTAPGFAARQARWRAARAGVDADLAHFKSASETNARPRPAPAPRPRPRPPSRPRPCAGLEARSAAVISSRYETTPLRRRARPRASRRRR